jgi:hypothetical protein
VAAKPFPKFFNPEDLGQSLKEVAMEMIKTSRRDVVNRWFHSNKDADLFIWSDLKGNILKQQLTYYGQIIEWNIIEGVKTGHTVFVEGRSQEQGSEFISFDEKPQKTSIEQAVKLLSFITALQEVERQTLGDNFLKVGQSQNMPEAKLIARFGEFLGSPITQTPRGAWKRLVERVSSWFKA